MEQKPFSDISFEQFLNEEKLMGVRCRDCCSLYVPPRPICTTCHSEDMEWVQMTGTGTLLAFTCITIGSEIMRAEGYDRHNPYCSGVVQLTEGARVDARIEGVDARNPESIAVGTSMRIKYLHRGTDAEPKTYLAFEPA